MGFLVGMVLAGMARQEVAHLACHLAGLCVNPALCRQPCDQAVQLAERAQHLAVGGVQCVQWRQVG